jgi:hypothetical protein
VSWKDNIQIRDLDPQDRIELTCRICKKTRYLTGAELHQRRTQQRLTLAQVEQRAKCRQRGCGGTMRMAMPHLGETKGFVGGMA